LIFPRSREAHEDGDSTQDKEDERNEEELRLVEQQIESWMSDIPEGFVRFFHGTCAPSVESILLRGIDQSYFARESDFGPAFYCADGIHLSMLYSIYAVSEVGRSRGALISFDVPKPDFDAMNQLRLTGKGWADIVFQCQSGNADRALSSHKSAAVVVGCMSHDPEDAEAPHDVRAFDDRRMQFAFRKDAGEILPRDLERVRVALFDVL
jgi:hypothetical protein